MAILAFGLYQFAFIAARVRLCKAPAGEDGVAWPSECEKLTIWFQPEHLLIARGVLEVVTVALSDYWVFMSFWKSWSRFRLIITVLFFAGAQGAGSWAILNHDQPRPKGIYYLTGTRGAAWVALVALPVLIGKLKKWKKAMDKPIVVLHPEKNTWLPSDGLALDEAKKQVTWASTILVFQYLYNLFITLATYDVMPAPLNDPYSLLHVFLLLILASTLITGYFTIHVEIAKDERVKDTRRPPEGRLPFLLVLKKDHVVACTRETRAEVEQMGEELPTDAIEKVLESAADLV